MPGGGVAQTRSTSASPFAVLVVEPQHLEEQVRAVETGHHDRRVPHAQPFDDLVPNGR